jgi:hypothetical protein
MASPNLGAASDLVTDTMSDGDTLALLGATAVFGVRSDQEAERSLSLLGLDPDDERPRRRLQDLCQPSGGSTSS